MTQGDKVQEATKCPKCGHYDLKIMIENKNKLHCFWCGHEKKVPRAKVNKREIKNTNKSTR